MVKNDSGGAAVIEKTLVTKNAGPTKCWFGTVDKSPFQNVIIEGITFHRFTEVILDDQKTLKTKRISRIGLVLEFSQDQIKKIRSYIERAKIGNRMGRKCIMDPEAPAPKGRSPYMAQVKDEPLSRYVYFLPVDMAVDSLGAMWQQDYPPPYEDMKNSSS